MLVTMNNVMFVRNFTRLSHGLTSCMASQKLLTKRDEKLEIIDQVVGSRSRISSLAVRLQHAYQDRLKMTSWSLEKKLSHTEIK